MIAIPELQNNDDCDSRKVLLEGPPTVYIVNSPITFHSIGVITSECAD